MHVHPVQIPTGSVKDSDRNCCEPFVYKQDGQGICRERPGCWFSGNDDKMSTTGVVVGAGVGAAGAW